MAITAALSWNPKLGALGYRVEYKKAVDSSWTVFDSNLHALSCNITGLDEDTDYNFRIVTLCSDSESGGNTITDITPHYIWIPDVFGCEQESIIMLDSQKDGLSSPGAIMYDEPSDRFYVVDYDDVNGNFYWFDPVSFPSDPINYVGGVTDYIYNSYADYQYRRLYACGKNTGGLKVLDLATDTVSTVPYGIDHTAFPSGSGFNRLSLTVLTSKILTIDEYSDTLTIIDRATLAVDSTLAIGSIPSGTSYIGGGCFFVEVGSEIWVIVSQQSGVASPDIARYSSDFSTFIGTINLFVYSDYWVFSGYWRSVFNDVANQKLYVYDMGNNTLIVIDTFTLGIVYVNKIYNTDVKTNSSFSFVIDPITDELFMSGLLEDTPSDVAPILRTYKINRTSFEFEQVIPDFNFSALVRYANTNKLFGTYVGQFAWSGNPDWDIDGIIYKFTR